MRYIVNGRRRFAELQDALDYAALIYRRTGNIAAVDAL
jgi:hypothetical protein